MDILAERVERLWIGFEQLQPDICVALDTLRFLDHLDREGDVVVVPGQRLVFRERLVVAVDERIPAA